MKNSAKDGNAPVVPQQLRNLVANVRDLSDQMKKNAENPNSGQTPWQRQRKADAAGDLEKTLPELVKKSKGTDYNSNNNFAHRNFRRFAPQQS